MKYLLIIFSGLWVSIGHAQTTATLNQVSQLVKSFESKKDNALLESALEKLSELSAKEGFSPSAESYFLNAKTRTLMLKHMELDEPLTMASEITENFDQSLILDQNKSWRDIIHEQLYNAKILMTELGNESYEAEDFNMAHAHYSNAVELNNLEVAYPRFVRHDTTLMYTTAVFASLSDKNKEAISRFEELVDMDYSRRDIYDYLINLYRKEEMEDKAVMLEKKKAKRYPE